MKFQAKHRNNAEIKSSSYYYSYKQTDNRLHNQIRREQVKQAHDPAVARQCDNDQNSSALLSSKLRLEQMANKDHVMANRFGGLDMDVSIVKRILCAYELYENLTIRDICELAGISYNTFLKMMSLGNRRDYARIKAKRSRNHYKLGECSENGTAYPAKATKLATAPPSRAMELTTSSKSSAMKLATAPPSRAMELTKLSKSSAMKLATAPPSRAMELTKLSKSSAMKLATAPPSRAMKLTTSSKSSAMKLATPPKATAKSMTALARKKRLLIQFTLALDELEELRLIEKFESSKDGEIMRALVREAIFSEKKRIGINA